MMKLLKHVYNELYWISDLKQDKYLNPKIFVESTITVSKCLFDNFKCLLNMYH